MTTAKIVKCAIHPAIGIARVGNSPDQYFIGPEVPGILDSPAAGYKDEHGRIKRQAARFRIYGLDSAGNVVRELSMTDNDVDSISWTVHLANKKAAWYNFDLALDIPVAAELKSNLRNSYLQTPEERAKLIIDPGSRTLSAPNEQARFDTGTFQDTKVELGEIFTDSTGHLVVLGGFGHSSSPDGSDVYTFANNDGWHDDTSDGPVSARVVIDGEELEVEPAWVIVAPPDFAPGIYGVVTMYDIALEAAHSLHPVPIEVSFAKHILPIFTRFSLTQWVNEGFYREFGYKAPWDFLNPELLQHLADPSAEMRPLRQEIFEKFRHPSYEKMERDAWPPVYGDGMDVPAYNPRNWLTMTRLQYAWLEQWAQGNFISDYSETAAAPAQRLEDLPLADRPHALDEAALEWALGGAFHPGCEATWPMRILSLYSAPFRIKHAPPGKREDFGPVLTAEIALGADGPLSGGSLPGDLTRWMAVPWQTDTASCRSGYEPKINKYLPTFWPARVPNHVLSEENYKIVMNENLTMPERQDAFDTRTDWLEAFPSSTKNLNRFVEDWYKVGVIVRQDGPADTKRFPSSIHVEMGNELKTK
ncbi:hypothetical protein EV586_11519 [Tumebacillus sp. BK434]|uniref:LodA/GoxA family CTQ-dependent oxidase n=1 Tax=Tumebacillus sp. BK434 TaxID=2512169 RepID=UPI00105134AE|nr:LodA/GoxA family CTQ-dependent oxidase [Tumebacillus sp. BK434]TCP52148.1 hypothetical protein EV586_11519 [Tumebacillus sp. BK434]